MPLSEALRQQLSSLIESHRVVLFMKGNRQFPQCGFSAQVVQILNGLVPTYETVNVLADPAVREGIKELSSWPTIPQLYVDGQFVGGCDIVKDLHATGELQKLLGTASIPTGGAASPPAKAPTIRITDSAAAAFRSATEEGADRLRLEIGPDFQYDLFFAPPNDGDVEASSNGITIRFDPAGAAKADGLAIDFVAGPKGGFKITSPHEPARVKPLNAADLKRMIDEGAPLALFDVRTDHERAIATIPSACPLDAAGTAHLRALDKNALIVFYCHHGGRSQAAAEQFAREGFRNVHNLEGGIDAWSMTVDPSVRRY